ncbi:uncharacterized protein PS065_003401 [Dugong dugon]
MVGAGRGARVTASGGQGARRPPSTAGRGAGQRARRAGQRRGGGGAEPEGALEFPRDIGTKSCPSRAHLHIRAPAPSLLRPLPPPGRGRGRGGDASGGGAAGSGEGRQAFVAQPPCAQPQPAAVARRQGPAELRAPGGASTYYPRFHFPPTLLQPPRNPAPAGFPSQVAPSSPATSPPPHPPPLPGTDEREPAAVRPVWVPLGNACPFSLLRPEEAGPGDCAPYPSARPGAARGGEQDGGTRPGPPRGGVRGFRFHLLRPTPPRGPEAPSTTASPVAWPAVPSRRACPRRPRSLGAFAVNCMEGPETVADAIRTSWC